METKYCIKNFRTFDENGVDLTFAPITILTGCNSSGKSSIVKSVFLLDSFLSEIKKAYEEHGTIRLDNYKLDFTSYPNNLLGRFDKVLNRDAKDRTITFEYTVYSLMLSEDITIQLVFMADENDQLNNGFLDSIVILNAKGVIFSSKNGEGNSYNLEIIKENLIDFIIGEFTIHNYCGLHSSYEFDNNISEDEFKAQKKSHFKVFKEIGKERILDITKYARLSNNKDSIVTRLNCGQNFLDWTYETKSLFRIPLVEVLSSSTKNTIHANIQSILPELPNEFSKIAAQKVINDFIQSESSNFGEYFRQKETEYLLNIQNLDKQTFLLKERVGVVNVPDKTDFILDQSILFDLQSVSFGSLNNNWELVYTSEQDKVKQQEENVRKLQDMSVTFSLLYEIIMLLNKIYDKSPNDYYRCTENYIGEEKYSHYMFDAAVLFLQDFVMEVLQPDWCGSFSYVSSSRINVKRMYSLDMNDDFSNLLKTYFEAKRLYLNKKVKGNANHMVYQPDDFMNKWVKCLGIGQSISISVDEEGLGAQIRLKKSESDSGCLLADEGYGITQLFSILLQIETAILSAHKLKIYKPYGLSMIDGYNEDETSLSLRTIAIEEPEIHLHPKYQSVLADMFNEAYQKYNIHFVIETHSEYLIRKEQVLVADVNNEYHVDNDKISLIYVNDAINEDEPRVKYIGICKDGYLNDSFGAGFFDEATTLSRKLL